MSYILYMTTSSPISKLRQLRSPWANGCGLGSGFFGDFASLRQNILDKDAMVENVAGTTFDRIAPTKDLFLSSESLQKTKNK